MAPDIPTSTTKKRKAPPPTAAASVDDFDVLLPAAVAATDSCHVLIQIDPQDASHLDLEGSSGAIGRFEATSSQIVLDCKGYQYAGTIHPGPTVMVLTHTSTFGGNTATDNDANNDAATVKIDAITNEFVTLSQVSNVMQKLNAVMVQGEMDDGYRVVDGNVNRNVNKNKKDGDDDAAANKKEGLSGEPPKKKRKTMASSATKNPKSASKKPAQKRGGKKS